MDSLGSRIKSARTALKLRQEDLATPFGIARTNVTAWESGKQRPDQDKLEPLARLLQVDLHWLMSGEGSPKPVDNRTRSLIDLNGDPLSMPRVQAIPASELVASGPPDLPVYAGAQGGDGHIIVSFDAIDYVKRPEPLRNVRGGYGLLIAGTSMVPAYREGDIALVHPHLPPARDTEVILYHTPPGGEAEAIIKSLVNFNDHQWTLEQYNPHKVFDEYRAEWPVCHRCVGKYSRR